jgi:hypothetical protein
MNDSGLILQQRADHLHRAAAAGENLAAREKHGFVFGMTADQGI